MEIKHIIGPILAVIVFFILVYPIRRLANKVALVDKPNHRKVHQNPIPLIGGITLFLSVCFTFLICIIFFDLQLQFVRDIFPASLILLILGVADDRFDIRAILKLAIQLLLAHIVYMQGIKIESFFGLFGIYEIAEWLKYLLTVFVIAGVMNAFNLMDGIDGLAGGMAILGFTAYAFLAYSINQYNFVFLFLIIIASLVSFLRFNLSKKKKIFMGDAGSLLLGFVLVVSAIKLIQLTQSTDNIQLIATGVIAVLIIPVFDSLRVYRKRLKSGKSPFSADKTHLHHLIIFTGLKHKNATLVIVLFMFIIISIGYISYEIIGINIAIIAMLFIFYLVTQLLQFNNSINFWKEKIKTIEFKDK